MCRGALICLLLALWITGALGAQTPTVPAAESGRAAFADGKKFAEEGKDARQAFRRAMRAFQQPDPNLMRTAWAQDFGNAAFLADDLARAILAFRYGLSQDRHHAILRQNLQYARSQVQYAASGERGRPEREDWPSWLPRLRMNCYVSVGALSYCAGWLALTCLFFRRRLGIAVVAGTCFALAAAAGYGCFVMSQQWNRNLELPPAIIRHDNVALLVGNGTSYPRHAELPTLARGMEARRMSIRGDWWQIRFASGEIGWIPAREALSWEDLRN